VDVVAGLREHVARIGRQLGSVRLLGIKPDGLELLARKLGIARAKE
jgi:hypothetical protein